MYSSDAVEGDSLYANGDALIVSDVPIDPTIAPIVTFGGWVKVPPIESEVFDAL